MPKTKQPAIESSFHHLDRLSEKQGLFSSLLRTIDTLSGFYGFEKISYSLLDNPKAYQPLIKAGITGERPFVIFKALGAPDVMLRASFPLSALRAYKAHKMHEFPQPIKACSQGEIFFASSREDQPIQRRDEVSLITIGEAGPIAEAQIVQVIWKSLLERGALPERLTLMVNAVGCSQCFGHFRSLVSTHIRSKVGGLCKNCKRNFKLAPTRILICEEEKCRIATSHAPQMLDHLCENCKKHLRGFLEFLDEMGISYYIDARRFRTGFWADTVLFEFMYALRPVAAMPDVAASILEEGVVATEKNDADSNSELLDEVAQSQSDTVPGKRGIILAEGGRLSRAAELMGAKGVEAAAGTLLVDAIEQGLFSHREQVPDIYLAQLGEMARRKSLKVLEILRLAGITARESLGRDAIKSQLKLAEKIKAPIALILGQKEVIDGTIIVRETDSGIQETVPQEKLIDFLKKRLKRESL